MPFLPTRAMLLAAVLVVLGMTLPALADDNAPRLAPTASLPTADGKSMEFENPAEPFTPLKPRSAREEDRVRALGLFAAGRVAEQKQDEGAALRFYERAYRLDTNGVTILREIVPLAIRLERHSEALRYAVILARHDPTDPQLLLRLSNYLAEAGEIDQAINMLTQALALFGKEKPNPASVLARLQLARLCFAHKRYPEAAQYFHEVQKALDAPQEYGLDATSRRAIIGRPDQLWQQFGESYLEAGRFDEALAAFDKAHAARPDEALRSYQLARIDARKKRPAQALARLDGYLNKNQASQGTAPYELLSSLLTELGLEDQLIARLEKLRATDADNIPLAYFTARRMVEAQELDKAAALYRTLSERSRSRPPLEAYQGLVDIQRRKKDVNELLTRLGEAVNRVGSLSPLGESAKALVADREMVQALILAALTENADGPKRTYGSLLAAGLLAMDISDYDNAEILLNKALEADPSKAAEALLTWGMELFLVGEHARAATVFQRGIDSKALPENNPAFYYYLAGALEMSGRTDDALAAARHAAEAQPDQPRFASRVAWVQFHGKRYDAARASYQELINKFDKVQDPADARDVLREARLAMSNLAVAQGQNTESEEWLEQVLDEFPEDAGALNDLGYLWADSSRHLDRALEMIQIAVAEEPKNMAFRDSLGWVYFRLGRYPEAVAELKVAASVDDADGVILDHLADALEKTGDRTSAIEHWTRAAGKFDAEGETAKAKTVREKIERAKREESK